MASLQPSEVAAERGSNRFDLGLVQLGEPTCSQVHSFQEGIGDGVNFFSFFYARDAPSALLRNLYRQSLGLKHALR